MPSPLIGVLAALSFQVVHPPVSACVSPTGHASC